MGNGMNKVLPGLFLGSVRDAKDTLQLKENNITHILSIHDNAKKLHADIEFLCISASDSPDQDLSQYFSICNDFIHRARLAGGAVLIHCLAGVSRSVTVTVAYIMTITSLGWRDSLNVVRSVRRAANPNFGFQRQLLAFEHDRLPKERERFKSLHAAAPYNDDEICEQHLQEHWKWVLKGDQEDPCDPGQGLYPLPHQAYSLRLKNKKATNKEDAEKSQFCVSKPGIKEDLSSQDNVQKADLVDNGNGGTVTAGNCASNDNETSKPDRMDNTESSLTSKV